MSSGSVGARSLFECGIINTTHMEKHKPELEFVTSSEEILRILIHSKEYGNVVGISSPLLGAGIFITAVEKVILDYEVVVVLKPRDVNGRTLDKNILKLTELTCACAFRSRFDKLVQKATLVGTDAGVYSY
jgi:hypothetical protein